MGRNSAAIFAGRAAVPSTTDPPLGALLTSHCVPDGVQVADASNHLTQKSPGVRKFGFRQLYSPPFFSMNQLILSVILAFSQSLPVILVPSYTGPVTPRSRHTTVPRRHTGLES